tara:strand:- start:688 stop:1137 length:450 start_codon:yes stop_codon:yes gene_type:complete
MINRVLFLILFLLSSCGYQPLYSEKENLNFSTKELELIGDANINKKIINILFIKVDKVKFQNNKITLESNKNIVETSKNKQGQPDSFKMVINFKLSIVDKENNLVAKNFSEEFSYKNKDNKFELSEYEINLEQNLINNIINKIRIFTNI